MDVRFRSCLMPPSFEEIYSTMTKNAGIRKIPSDVAKSMPPTTATPMPLRAAAPAPVAIAKGRQPMMNAKDVMRIGSVHPSIICNRIYVTKSLGYGRKR